MSYYKYLLLQLTHFLAEFNTILKGHAIPQDVTRAQISVISKPDEDPPSYASNMLVSLLNCDLKLFLKTFFNQLSPNLQWIISSDQSGFIPTRDNTIQTINNISRARNVNSPLLLCLQMQQKPLRG